MISDLPDMLCSRRKGRIIREFRPADGLPHREKTVSLVLDRFPIEKPSGARPSCRQNRPKTSASLVLSCGRSQRAFRRLFYLYNASRPVCIRFTLYLRSFLPCFAVGNHRSLRFCDFLRFLKINFGSFWLFSVGFHTNRCNFFSM